MMISENPLDTAAAVVPDAPPVKILLVDDKVENLISLESLLSKEGENISYLFANSGDEALKLALQEELALILLDVQMPGMNGYEVARYLRDISKTREIPIIFVTAINQQEAHVTEGFEAGAVDFLFKPLHPYITKAKVNAFVRFYLQKKELERANQQLEERVQERTRELTMVNQDLDNFVYTASHDLKAPIHNLEGLITALNETLQESGLSLGQVPLMMDMMQNTVRRFKSTLADLTEIAKVQHDKGTADAEQVNLQDLLEDVKLSIRDMIGQYNAHITDDFTQLQDISFSRKNLRSIFYNLLSNSIKYSSPHRRPEIHVSCCKLDGYTLLQVKDNGLGLRKQDHEKVFGMFRRAHTHVEGTGVGLAIVKKIVENAHGRIEVESEVDRGTVFKVYLP